MTSAPLSPALPLFLHVAASRSRACWILLAPTYQLLTLPCPLEFHPPFSATTLCLDTPAVGSPMMACACWIRLAPTHQLSTLPCPLELQPPFHGTTRTLPCPHWAVSWYAASPAPITWMPAARAQPSGDLHAAKIPSLLPFPPSLPSYAVNIP